MPLPAARTFAMAVVLVTQTASPAAAQDLLSALFGPAQHEQAETWTTAVAAEPVPARDPAWTATIAYARRAPGLETGTIGSVASLDRVPRLTGASHALDGVASYYWQEQMTASGEVFNKRDMTAAHKTLPLGTRVRVTNLDNGRSAIVRINDRGPYIKGRVIDVSEAAAEVLDMHRQGLAPVKVELVQNEN